MTDASKAETEAIPLKADLARPPLEGPAARALAEAETRRKAQLDREAELARLREVDGRKGPEPVRYGDWESKGLASDF